MMSEPLCIATGLNGVVTLFSDRLSIKRKGVTSFFTHGLQGEKEVAISAITGMQFKNAGMITNGYIQFVIFGSQESKGGIFNAMSDENTVAFKTSQQADFETLRQKVQEAIFDRSERPAGASSGLDDLEKLAALRDKGIITADEFDKKKRQILGL